MLQSQLPPGPTSIITNTRPTDNSSTQQAVAVPNAGMHIVHCSWEGYAGACLAAVHTCCTTDDNN